MIWKEYKICDIATVLSGATPATSDLANYDGEIVWITPKDLALNNSKYISRGERNLTEKGYKGCSTQLIPPYNILMSSRAPIGLLAINRTECCTNQGFKNLVIDKSICDVDFFYYYLKYHISEVQALGSGTTFKEVSKSSLQSFVVSLPSLDEQKKIANVLSTLDEKIALNRQINDNLEAMARQLYDYWFVQFDFPDENGKPYKSSGGKMVWNDFLKRKIPEKWDKGKIGELILPIERGISYSSKDIADKSGIPMINLACFSKSGDYRTGEMKYFSGDLPDSKYIGPLDMLVACTDMTQGADIIGRPILTSSEYNKFTFSTDLALIRPKSKFKMYLYYSLRTSFYHRYIRPFASGTTVKHLNVKGIENYKIPLPTERIQRKFEEIILPIKIMQNNNINEIEKLSKLRDKLLPLLMNGQATINYHLSDD